MGRKDEILNSYFSDVGRFCDFFNGAVFGGQQTLKPEDTVPRETVSRTSGAPRRQRDVCMQSGDRGNYAIYAVENQTAVHYGMVVRIMLMDAMEYDRQLAERARIHKRNRDLRGSGEYLSGLAKRERLAPVMTVVFYYGEEPWDGSRSLRELLELPPELEEYREYFPDYPLRLIEPGQVEPGNFQTEWKTLMRMLQLKDKPEEFLAYVRGLGKEEGLSREGLMTAAVLLEDERLLEQVTEEEEEKSMCTAIDYLCEKAESRGKEEGRRLGLEEGRNIGMLEGRQAGMCEGRQQSQREMLELIRLLAKENRLEEFLGEKENPERIDWWIQTYCPRDNQ